MSIDDLDAEDVASVRFGAGFYPMVPLSPERRAAFEVEEAKIDAQLEADRQALESDRLGRIWFENQTGVQRHTVSEFLAGIAAKSEREDRKEARKLHSSECGCIDCGNRYYGVSGAQDPRPKPVPVPPAPTVEETVSPLEARVGRLTKSVSSLLGDRLPRRIKG